MQRLVRCSLVVGIASCTPATAPVGPRLENAPPPGAVAGRALPDGDYACTLTSGDYTYQPYLCRVATVDGLTHLVKLEGSQRVRGVLTFDGGSVRFRGEFFCAIGGCERSIDTVLAPSGDGAWGGGIGNDDSLRLVYQPAGMYAGAGYGADTYPDDGDYGQYLGGYGVGYGGFGYGGYGYGGYGYGPP